MTAYTQDELKKIRELRKEEQAKRDREGAVWDAAGVEHTESETVFDVYYQKKGSTSWISASPFYDPLRPEPGETHDYSEALRVADLILTGRWAPSKQGAPEQNIGRVRVVERVASAKIVAELAAPEPTT